MEEHIENKRARYAYDRITAVKETATPIQKKYSSEVNQTAVRVHNSGLMQTLAFYCSKMDDSDEKKKHFVYIASHILDYLNGSATVSASPNKQSVLTKFDSLLNECSAAHMVLMLKTGMAKEVLIWLKRFSDAMLEKDQSATGGGTGAR